MSDVIHEL